MGKKIVQKRVVSRGETNKKGVNEPNGTLTIYCRTSGTKDKNELSLDVQESRGIQMSKKLGLEPRVIKEKGSGIKPYDEVRPLFTDLVDDISDNKISNFWVDDKTRLTRNDSDEQFVYMLMKQNDVNMYYGLDTTPKKWDWITDLVDTIITTGTRSSAPENETHAIQDRRKRKGPMDQFDD